MKRFTTIELSAENMSFSAGHFITYSSTHRERLHGHNFHVQASITAEVESIGMTFDYRIYQDKLVELCKGLDTYFLLPEKSLHVKYEDIDNHCTIYFDKEKITFPKKDVQFLPVVNITLEELSQWFVDQLIADKEALNQHSIQNITIKVFSGPGQCAQSNYNAC